MNIIKKLRLGKNWNQSRLAKISKLTTPAICQFEKNKRLPCFESLVKLSKALDCSVDTIVDGLKKKE